MATAGAGGRSCLIGDGAVATSGVLLAGLGGLAGAAFALVVFGVGRASCFGGAVPWLDESFGELDRGLAYGGLNLVFAVGYTIGPLVGGWLLETASADLVYLLMTAISVAGGTALALRRTYPGSAPVR